MAAIASFHQQPGKFYQAFVDCYGRKLAKNLDATLDGQELTFACVKSEYHLRDEQNQVLGHLRCDFVFQARAQVRHRGKHKSTLKLSPPPWV